LNPSQKEKGYDPISSVHTKYNQLLRIEEELGDNAIYGGKMR
jgi:enolase